MATSIDLARIRKLCRTGTSRRIRIAADVSHADIARDIGTTPGTISHWEASRRSPSGEAALRYLAIIEELAQITGIPVE